MAERVSGVDAAVLRLDSPTNLMVITGILTLGSPIELERLRATLAARLLPFDRFRQQVVFLGKDGVAPCWEEDLDLDLDYHVQRIALDPPGDEAALQEVVSRMVSVPLNPNRPLWQFHLVEPYGEGCVVICRVHHAVGDGLALIRVLLSLADIDADAPYPAVPAVYEAAPGQDRSDGVRPMRARILAGRRLGRKLVRKSLRLAAHPSRIRKVGAIGTRATLDLGALALTGAEPNTVLRGELGHAKRAAWSAAVPLDRVKMVGRRLGGTVNDVLLATVCGALRRYLIVRGEVVDGVELHAAIPVSMRPAANEAELGNEVGAVLLLLPVCVADPVERLALVRKRMDQAKNSLQAPIILYGLKAFGALPPAIETTVVNYYSSRLTAVMTNVPGPRERLYLAGAPIEALMFWVPKTGAVGLGVSILSYAGDVRLGIITDAGLVPDPEVIVGAFEAEFQALLAQTEGMAEPVSLGSCLSMLDGALDTLDSVLASRREVLGLTEEEGLD